MYLKTSLYRDGGKRLFDVLAVFVALPILAPVLLVVAICVRLFLGKSVLFKQERPGLAGRPFFILKFRTMTDERDADGELLPDAERLTSFGRFLRSTSLDELPEFWNVLKGEMSLVGPRPLLMQYLTLYSAEQKRRHDVKPGITGWAQINGRNQISWEDKFKHDIWYVDNLNLYLDLKIIFATVFKLLKREGVNQPGHVTVENFKGVRTTES